MIYIKVEKIIESKMDYINNGFTKEQASFPIKPISFSDDKKMYLDATIDDFDINQKCLENSANLNVIEISKFFEFEPKFNLNPTVRSLIEKYKEEK